MRIADTVGDFVRETEAALRDRRSAGWRCAVDVMLSTTSWDRTWARMAALVDQSLQVAVRPRSAATWTERLRPSGEA